MEWGSKATNQRGYALLKTFSALDVILLNTGAKNNFEKNGRGSYIDTAFVSPALAIRINWPVSDTYTHSHHLTIIRDISSVEPVLEISERIMKTQTKG